MSKVKKNARPVKKNYSSPFSICWTKENYYLLILGLVLLTIGFYVMSIGSWDNPVALTLSPLLLITGYLLVLPSSIFYKKKLSEEKPVTENVNSKS
ncbi:MAG: hypothetical protein WCJ01_04475 [Ignavibacteria bacterium]